MMHRIYACVYSISSDRVVFRAPEGINAATFLPSPADKVKAIAPLLILGLPDALKAVHTLDLRQYELGRRRFERIRT